MSTINYNDCTAIRPRNCSAWELELPDGTRKVVLFAADAPFEDVHQYCTVHHKKFKLSQITVGEMTFDLKGSDQIYKSDSRAFDEEMNMAPLGNSYL